MKGEPFVQLILRGDVIAQMDSTEARDHARAITEAAEAAEQDAFLVDWLQYKMDLTFDQACASLIDYRTFREAHGKSSGPSHPSKFVVTDEMRAQLDKKGRRDSGG